MDKEKKKYQLTKDMTEAIRFYMGDPKVCEAGLWRGGPEAYNTINALLHPGTGNEEDKAREGRVMEIYDGAHMESYIRLILQVLAGMALYLEQAGDQAPTLSYRIDRASSLNRFREDGGVISGFFSTCRWGFLPAYAHKKAGIVLLEVERERQLPFLDFSTLFGDLYAKPEEAEILLPFGSVIEEMHPVPLTEEEKGLYTDFHGMAPEGKWHLRLGPGIYPEVPEDHLKALRAGLTDESMVRRVSGCLQVLTSGRPLDQESKAFYCAYKEKLMTCICGEAAKIFRQK